MFITDYLYSVSFRDVSFPVLSFTSSNSNSLVSHQIYNKDGDYLENTGRNSSVFSMQAVFNNTLSPSASETWQRGTLFPTVFNEVRAALLNKEVGRFIHPTIGNIDVMVEGFNEELSADNPSAAIININLKEFVDASDLSSFIDSKIDASPEAYVEPIREEIKYIPLPERLTAESAFDQLIRSMNQASGLVSKKASEINRYLSAVDRVVYSADKMVEACEKMNSVLTVGIIQRCNKIRNRYKEISTKNGELLSSVSITGQMSTIKPMTIAELSKTTNNTVSELIKLNGPKVIKPVIPFNTNIKYLIK